MSKGKAKGLSKVVAHRVELSQRRAMNRFKSDIIRAVEHLLDERLPVGELISSEVGYIHDTAADHVGDDKP